MSKPKDQIARTHEQDAGTPEVLQSRIGAEDLQDSRPEFEDGASANLPRVCLYARDNTNTDRESSVDGQLQAARERAAGERWCVVAVHVDHGVSGRTPMALRPGGQLLRADALAHRFDILIVKGTDRLGRDISEIEAIILRLKRLGIQMIGAGDGYDSEAPRKGLDHALRALMSELIQSDHRTRVHRGLAGSFNRGCHIGGIPHGCASQPAPRGLGRHLLIDPVKASIVKRIFTDLAAGQTTLGIVRALNDEGVPGPRGREWAVSALVGNSKRGTGVLNNELYVGRRTWNRRVWQRDPVTGTCRGVDRPRSEWLLHESPHLRILSTHLWESARRCAGLGETL